MNDRFASRTAWIRRGGVAAGRGLATVGLSLLAVPTLIAFVAALASVIFPGLFVVPRIVMATRWLANRMRHLAGAWSAVAIPTPYQPAPPAVGGASGWWQRLAWIVSDPATWRDLLWLLVAPVVAVILAGAAPVLIAVGVFGLAQPLVWRALAGVAGAVHITGPATAATAAVLGAASLLLGLAAGPGLLHANARVARWLLAPTPNATLALRVRQLVETRSDALDAQVAELRRIERDLHDGAQARLVAMGMTLSAAEALLEKDPSTARGLLGEAREASTRALNELRDLVRGIHPPVLADRGLADAVRALALDSGPGVAVSMDLSGRPVPAVEAAAYFAISELLANAAKHARATRVSVDVRHRDGMLLMAVTDDGIGGARIEDGTGLRGIQRRLATFDGTLALDSPPGGPTTVLMELPCELSSPRITPSSGTG